MMKQRELMEIFGDEKNSEIVRLTVTQSQRRATHNERWTVARERRSNCWKDKQLDQQQQLTLQMNDRDTLKLELEPSQWKSSRARKQRFLGTRVFRR